jgi:hypothetical protein
VKSRREPTPRLLVRRWSLLPGLHNLLIHFMPALVRSCLLGLFWVLLTQGALPARGQELRYTLSGTVRTAVGELLPGASVAVPALNTGVAADERGNFSLALPRGRHQVAVSFVGYRSVYREVT